MAYGEKSLDAILQKRDERLANQAPKSPEKIEEQRAKAARAAAEIAVQQAEQAQRDRGEVVARDLANDELWAEYERRAEEERATDDYSYAE